MKCHLFLTILSLFLYYGSMAQRLNRFHMGIQGSPQLSWMINENDRANDAFEYIPTLNSSFGISTQYLFTPVIPTTGFGMDLLYSYQGQRFRLEGTERIKKLYYIKLPLMLIYNKKINKDFMLIGKIGPQFAFLADSKYTNQDGVPVGKEEPFVYKKSEIGVVAAAGIGITLVENVYIDLVIRGDYGFTDAEDKNFVSNVPLTESEDLPEEIANRAVTNNATTGFTIGVRIPIPFIRYKR